MHCPAGDDRGSGSILALGLLAATAIVALAVVTMGSGMATRQRVIAAADSAALAAADAASGAVAAVPCDAASRVAATAGASVETCRVDGLIATIEVSGAFAGVPIRARSTAGPPP